MDGSWLGDWKGHLWIGRQHGKSFLKADGVFDIRSRNKIRSRPPLKVWIGFFLGASLGSEDVEILVAGHRENPRLGGTETGTEKDLFLP